MPARWSSASDPEALAEEVVRRGLSVRETEKLAQAGKARKPRQPPIEYKGAGADIAALERQLGDLLGLKVAIRHGPKGGQVVLGYSSLDQLDMICQRLERREVLGRSSRQRSRAAWRQIANNSSSAASGPTPPAALTCRSASSSRDIALAIRSPRHRASCRADRVFLLPEQRLAR